MSEPSLFPEVNTVTVSDEQLLFSKMSPKRLRCAPSIVSGAKSGAKLCTVVSWLLKHPFLRVQKKETSYGSSALAKEQKVVSSKSISIDTTALVVGSLVLHGEAGKKSSGGDR